MLVAFFSRHKYWG